MRRVVVQIAASLPKHANLDAWLASVRAAVDTPPATEVSAHVIRLYEASARRTKHALNSGKHRTTW